MQNAVLDQGRTRCVYGQGSSKATSAVINRILSGPPPLIHISSAIMHGVVETAAAWRRREAAAPQHIVDVTGGAGQVQCHGIRSASG